MSGVEALAAAAIEPLIEGSFDRRQRAADIAESLFWAGYLRGGRDLPDVHERVLNDLVCRMSRKTAQAVVNALAARDLLTTSPSPEESS